MFRRPIRIGVSRHDDIYCFSIMNYGVISEIGRIVLVVGTHPQRRIDLLENAIIQAGEKIEVERYVSEVHEPSKKPLKFIFQVRADEKEYTTSRRF